VEEKPAFAQQKTNGTSISIIEDKEKAEPTFKEQENELEDTPKIKTTFSLKVTSYYPLEFEALRITNNITITQFIRSIASCNVWNSDGGKSGASFFKSADELFVFKRVKESEFFMFDDFAPSYFEYSHRSVFQDKPTVLNKIFGMFEIEYQLHYSIEAETEAIII
jgi:1-phosphatidylinositol-3-phosphate 5-kinase